MKKFLFAILICLVITALVVGLFLAFKERRLIREQRQAAKAPQKSIKIIEGWDNQQIAVYLEQLNLTSKNVFLEQIKKINFDNLPNVPKQAEGNLEGFLFPDTYFVPTPADSTELSKIIINKQLKNFNDKITAAMTAQSSVNGLRFYQTITLASILEKEGKSLEDKKIIAGVFYNRLKLGMALQSDATLNYVLKSKNASLTSLQLEIDSPYNSYKYRGLPPTPICNPGLDSIQAALWPAQTDYLYFLTDPKTGKAIFAKTLQEHNINKQKFLR